MRKKILNSIDHRHFLVFLILTALVMSGCGGDGGGSSSSPNPTTWYQDADTDGYGDPAVSTTAATRPAGYVADNTDCDDRAATVYPGCTEVWNDDIDQDCNGKDIPYGDVTEYGQRINDQGRLSMIFVVPFATPIDLKTANFNYKIYDPDFFIAFDYIKGETVSAIGKLPKGCKINVGTVAFDENIEQTRQDLAEKPVDWQPEQPQDFGSLFAQPVSVSCEPAAS